MHDKQDELLISVASTPFAILVGVGILCIVIMQSLWQTIEGLYFNYAYEAIVYPFTIYLVWNMYSYSKGGALNRSKLLLMFIAFTSLFLPAMYLYVTNQLSGHQVVFGEFDAALDHMSHASILPYFALASVLIPYPDFLYDRS